MTDSSESSFSVDDLGAIFELAFYMGEEISGDGGQLYTTASLPKLISGIMNRCTKAEKEVEVVNEILDIVADSLPVDIDEMVQIYKENTEQ